LTKHNYSKVSKGIANLFFVSIDNHFNKIQLFPFYRHWWRRQHMWLKYAFLLCRNKSII